MTTPDIVIVISAVGVVINNAIQTWKLNNKVDVINQKTAVIEGHVNSQQTKYIEQIASKDKEIALLNDILIKKDKEAALLAQAAINRVRVTDIVKTDPAIESLTKEISENTAATVKAVKDLKEFKDESSH